MDNIVSKLLRFHSYRSMKNLESHYEDKVKIPSELVERTKKNDHLVWFYAHWCGHCEVVIDEWDKLRDKSAYLGCDLLEINCGKYPKMREFMGDKVSGYPTFLYIDKNFETTDFATENVKRTAYNFEKFVKKMSN